MSKISIHPGFLVFGNALCPEHFGLVLSVYLLNLAASAIKSAVEV